MMRRLDLMPLSPGKSALAVALAVLALAGCAVGPDYQRPAADLPDSFKASAADSAPEAAALVEKEWWKLFQDPQLNGLVAKALAHNFDLQAAVARVEEAEGVAREAGATFFPQIDLNAGGSRTVVSNQTAVPMPATTPRMRDSSKAALSTSFEIDVWGKLRRGNEVARAQLLSSRYARDTVELSVAGLVTSSYLALRAADANLALTRSTVDSRQKALDIVNRRLAGGAASHLDLNQAEGTLAAAVAQQADLRRQRALAENQLALLTGEPRLSLPVAGDLRQLPLPPTPPAGLPSQLLEARPDIRQAEEDLIAANARIGVAKSALFPSLSLTGSVGSESAALANLFTSAAGTWSLGLAVALPIFDAGRNSARIDQASARQKQLLANYQKTVQSAFKEVNDALVGLRENGASETAQDKRAKATLKSLELAQLRYEAGYSAFLEVLDAQRNANDALLSYVATRQARLNSTVDLFKALGGGWKDGFKAESLKNSGAKEQPLARNQP